MSKCQSSLNLLCFTSKYFVISSRVVGWRWQLLLVGFDWYKVDGFEVTRFKIFMVNDGSITQFKGELRMCQEFEV